MSNQYLVAPLTRIAGDSLLIARTVRFGYIWGLVERFDARIATVCEEKS